MRFVKDKILTKKNLYILCFCILTIVEILSNCLIDSTETMAERKTIMEHFPGWLEGDILVVARNCTGFAMMLIIFSSYKWKELFSITNVIWTIICFVATKYLPDIKENIEGSFNTYQMQTVILNVWWMAIAVKKVINDYWIAKKVKFKLSPISIVWIVMTVFMYFSVNESHIWPVWYLVMFGIFFLTVYSEKDRTALWDGMIDGSILGFILLFTLSCLSRPYDEIRYRGLHGNSNIAGVYYLVIYVMVLCRLHVLEIRKSKIWEKILYVLLAGIVLALQFFTMCRTAWIITVIVTISYGIFVVRRIWNKKWWQVFARGVLIVLTMTIMLVPTFSTVRWGPTLKVLRIWQKGEYENAFCVHFEDEADSKKYIEWNDVLTYGLGRFSEILQGVSANNPLVMRAYAFEEVEPVDWQWLTDPSLQMRVTTYKEYLENLNWFGHKNEDGYFKITNSEDLVWNAQNVWIQMLYSYGIFAGVLLLALTVMWFIRDYKQMVGNKENPHSIIPFLLCVVFFGFGSMEVVWYLGQMTLFLIYFVHQPLDNTHLLTEGKRLESEREI